VGCDARSAAYDYRLGAWDRLRSGAARGLCSILDQDLEHQPLEIFRAAAEGEKIHTYLQGLQQRQSISSEELRTDKSDIIKEYDRLVKNPEARRQLEKQNPGLVAARDQAIVEIRREKLQKETAERQHKVARVRR